MRQLIRQIHISYFRDKVASYPDIRTGIWNPKYGDANYVWKLNKGKRTKTYRAGSPNGKKLLDILQNCDDDKRILLKLESEWIAQYGIPCKSVRINHYEDTPNRRLFDSLVCGRNPYSSKYTLKYKNTLFNSNLEVQFAKIMDEYGIPYKYEPEIRVFDGKCRYPDFVIYLPWLDIIILVEIFGLCDKDSYVGSIRDRFYDYMMSGWKPGRSMLSLFHYDNEIVLPEMIMEEIETVALRNLKLMKKAA